MHEGSITLRLSAEIKEIERLNRIVRQFGELHELPPRTLYSVNLALDEMVTNVILHGFREGEGEEIVVRMSGLLYLVAAIVLGGVFAIAGLAGFAGPDGNIYAAVGAFMALNGVGIVLWSRRKRAEAESRRGDMS